MRRLCLLALGAAAFAASPYGDQVGREVAELRERQYATGLQIGCQMRTVAAVRAEDLEEIERLAEECARLEDDGA